ncbi:MAG: hypothetical protein DRG78_18200 [Epsilonproteobacteria bacterium]|nr:MAG: hypothetical protein DRG78_18200 [Campylobacterota bacterium]
MEKFISYLATAFIFIGVVVSLFNYIYYSKNDNDIKLLTLKISDNFEELYFNWLSLIMKPLIILFSITLIFIYFRINLYIDILHPIFEKRSILEFIEQLPSIICIHILISLSILRYGYYLLTTNPEHTIHRLMLNSFLVYLVLYSLNYGMVYILQYSSDTMISSTFSGIIDFTNFTNYTTKMYIFSNVPDIEMLEDKQSLMIMEYANYIFTVMKFMMIHFYISLYIYFIYIFNILLIKITLKRFLFIMTVVSAIIAVVALIDFLYTITVFEIIVYFLQLFL